MAAKKPLDVRAITRSSTMGVFILSLAIVALTTGFIFKTLGAVSDAKSPSQPIDTPTVETVDLVLLETLRAKVEAKTMAPEAVTPDLKNPFRPVAAPAPAPEPQPAP